MTIAEDVIAIIAQQAVVDPADVRPEMTLADLGVDSLGLVEVIFAVEERWDVSVPFNANEPGKSGFDISSVASVIAGVERLVAAKAGT